MENTKECRNEHSMNSGWIYRKLCDNWKKYPRYLFSEIEKKLDYILIRDTRTLHPPLTWEVNRNYIEKSLREEKYYQERVKDNKNPPHTEFFMLPQKGGVEYYLIPYGSNFLLTYENDKSDFDFFFALKLLVTDEMKLKTFLSHQLAANFSDDFSQYKEFVDIILIKYNEFLANNKIDVIVNKFFQNIEEKENQIRRVQQPKQKKVTIKKTSQKIKKTIPKYLEDIIAKKDIAIYLDALKKVEPPVIDNSFHYRLGERQKGAVVAWVEVLRQKGKISRVNDEILSGLLNKKIKGLNLSTDGRTLRNLGTTAYNKYHNAFLDLIS